MSAEQKYEYWTQKRVKGSDDEWVNVWGTNRFSEDSPYPTPYGANYRIGVDRRRQDYYRRYWGEEKYPEYEYQVVRRPVGEWETF